MEQYFELADMIYEKRHGAYQVLAFGIRKGRYFFIVNVGGEWPAAYVEKKPEDPDDYESLNDVLFNEKHGEDALPHGGLIYGPDDLSRLKRAMKRLPGFDGILERKYWGWDYSHFGDYCTYKEEENLEEEDLLVKHSVGEIYEKNILPFIDYMSKKFANANDWNKEEEKL